MHVAIIGNGIAGITAARYIRKLSDYKITVISAETDHFYSRTALMYLYMGHMSYHDIKPYEDHFWTKNRINLLRDYVEKINPREKTLQMRNSGSISYDKLLIATGSVPRTGQWQNQDLQGVQSLYGMPDLDLMELNTRNCKHAAIVGGGLIGVEMAEMLHSRKIPVTLLAREEEFYNVILPTEEAKMIGSHIRYHGIDLRLSTELQEIKGANGRVSSITTSTGEEIPCDFLGITIGVEPNTAVAQTAGIEINRGILADEFLRTSQPDIYTAGDCAELRNPPAMHKSISPIWYTGRYMGETVAANICGKELKYQPGIFFNSAKFFDVEYQVYGTVPATPEEQYDSLFWQHPHKNRSIRIVHERSSQKVVGFNLLGIRFRHLVCDAWIFDEKTLDYVIDHINEAFFDPEFSHRYTKELKKVHKEKQAASV